MKDKMEEEMLAVSAIDYSHILPISLLLLLLLVLLVYY
jgi:hypothetical protein